MDVKNVKDNKQYQGKSIRQEFLLNKTMEHLQKAIDYRKEGNVSAADNENSLLHSFLHSGENEKDKNEVVFERNMLPFNGAFLGEGNNVILKAVSENEYEEYITVMRENADFVRMFDIEDFRKYVWADFWENEKVTFSIYAKDTMQFVGYCGIKNVNKTPWEIEIELLEAAQHKGYGFDALKVLINELFKSTGMKEYRSRVEVDNIASQGLMKKLGARPNGISEMFIYGEELKKFQQENINLIDEHMITVGQEFGVEPIELLGRVLEYIIIV